MRILETSEIDQVSGAGLLGLNLNLGVLDILGINAKVSVGDSRNGGHDDRGRGCGHDRRGRHC
jgi:hypothetical protein